MQRRGGKKRKRKTRFDAFPLCATLKKKNPSDLGAGRPQPRARLPAPSRHPPPCPRKPLRIQESGSAMSRGGAREDIAARPKISINGRLNSSAATL